MLFIRLFVRGEAVNRHLAGAGAVYSPVRLVVRLDGEDEVRYPMTAADSDSETGDYDVYAGSFPAYDRGLYWYYFEIDTYDGLVRIGRSAEDNKAVIVAPDEAPDCWQQTVYRQEYRTPAWIQGGIYYHIFIDRFCHVGEHVHMPGKVTRDDWGGLPEYRPQNGRILNNDVFGGNLKGITSKLDYLESLGVTCLYLSPVVEAYSSHKYDTADYTKVDPMFGTMEDFEALCRAAGERGIRVICDGVFSHTGADSIYFNKYKNYGDGGAYNDVNSPYRKWYYFHDDGTYDSWWGIDTLPRLNKLEPSYREFVNGTATANRLAGGTTVARRGGIAQYWLDHGANGWRLDVVDEFPTEFLTELVAAAKSAKPDALIVGEVWEDASTKEAYGERKNYFRGDRLDSVMNYPLKNAIIRCVRYGNARGLKEVVEKQWEHYPHYIVHSLMNILGTHNSARILTALAGKELDFDAPREIQATTSLTEEERNAGLRRLRVAVLLQMTLPGVPCIYYGDEAEMQGYKDPFNRRCYPWGSENESLLAWYRKVTGIRRSHEVYKKGGYRTIAARDGLFAFARFTETVGGPGAPAAGDEPDAAEIVTVVNCGEGEKELGLTGSYIDLLTGRAQSGSLTVAPGEALLLERQ